MISSCQGGYYEIVEFLISKGVSDFDQALSKLNFCEDRRIIEILKKNGAKNFNQFLYNITKFQDTFCNPISLEELIEDGADLNFVDPLSQKTVLDISFEKEFFNLIFFFIYHGSSLDKLDYYENDCESFEIKEILQDIKCQKLWNVKRNHLFPIIFKTKVFFFLLCIKFLSRKLKISVPKPLTHMILQFLFFLEREINISKKKN